MTERVLADLLRDGRTRVRISLGTYRGSRFIDLRTFTTAGSGELVPTAKGLSLRPDMLRRAIEALEAAERELAASPIKGPRQQ